MTPREEIVAFGPDNGLIGVVTYPRDFDSRRPAVLFLSPLLLQRTGTFRLSVTLARRLAELGFLCLRFDCSGVGESHSRPDDVPRHHADFLETVAALDFLREAFGVRQAVAAGICWGAMLGLLVAQQDPRVAGLIMIEPETVSVDSSDSVIYSEIDSRRVFGSLRRASSWRKALTGKAGYRAWLNGFLQNAKARLRTGARGKEADAAWSNLESLCARGVRMLMLFSPRRRGVDYFRQIQGNRQAPEGMRIAVVPQEGYAFITLASQDALFREVEDFLRPYLKDRV